MAKTDRVKQSTIGRKKRKGFNINKLSKEPINDDSENSVNTVNIVNTPPAANIVNTPPRPVHTPSGSAEASQTAKSSDPVTGYRLMDLEKMNHVISNLDCPECCEKKLKLKENVRQKMGLASPLYVFCSKFEYKNDF